MSFVISFKCDSGKSDHCHTTRRVVPCRTVVHRVIELTTAAHAMQRVARTAGWRFPGERCICPECAEEEGQIHG